MRRGVHFGHLREGESHLAALRFLLVVVYVFCYFFT